MPVKISTQWVHQRRWAPDDYYLVIPEIQVFAEDGFPQGAKVKVTIELIEEPKEDK